MLKKNSERVLRVASDWPIQVVMTFSMKSRGFGKTTPDLGFFFPHLECYLAGHVDLEDEETTTM